MAIQKIKNLTVGWKKKHYFYERKNWSRTIIDEYLYDNEGNLISSVENSCFGDKLILEKDLIFNGLFFEVVKKEER